MAENTPTGASTALVDEATRKAALKRLEKLRGTDKYEEMRKHTGISGGPPSGSFGGPK